jgi:hypothetical protein
MRAESPEVCRRLQRFSGNALRWLPSCEGKPVRREAALVEELNLRHPPCHQRGLRLSSLPLRTERQMLGVSPRASCSGWRGYFPLAMVTFIPETARRRSAPSETLVRLITTPLSFRIVVAPAPPPSVPAAVPAT